MFTSDVENGNLVRLDAPGLRANRTFQTYFDRLPIQEIEAVQLGGGTFDHRSLEIWGRDSVVVRDRLTPLASFTMVPDPDWVMILWPHVWDGDFRVNGHLSAPNSVFFRFDGGEWFTGAARRDTLSIGIRRSALVTACAALSGVDANEITLQRDSILNCPEFCAALSRIFARLLTAAQETGKMDGRIVMPPAYEADLISTLAAYFNASAEVKANAVRSHLSALQVVRIVQEAMRETDPACVGLSDLCRSAGVGRTRLHQCFTDVYGLPPGRYLKALRLTRARERLLDPFDPAQSVKEIALTLGFYTSGRFAREYRDMYGMFPSETRAQAVSSYAPPD